MIVHEIFFFFFKSTATDCMVLLKSQAMIKKPLTLCAARVCVCSSIQTLFTQARLNDQLNGWKETERKKFLNNRNYKTLKLLHIKRYSEGKMKRKKTQSKLETTIFDAQVGYNVLHSPYVSFTFSVLLEKRIRAHFFFSHSGVYVRAL